MWESEQKYLLAVETRDWGTNTHLGLFRSRLIEI